MTKDDQYQKLTGDGHNEGNISTIQCNVAASNYLVLL